MEIKIDKVCSTAFSRARGLMLSPKKTLLFVLKRPQRVLLHMWLVFYPIDVIFLDKDKRVIEIKKRFMPFNFYQTKKEACSFIELPYEKNRTVPALNEHITIKVKIK